MKRDVLVLPLNEETSLVIATDNSGSIGEQAQDAVAVPYEVVGYCSLRVAIMECLASRARPESIILHNFNGDQAWQGLLTGIKSALKEIKLESLSLVGSTETNFPLSQSASSLTVIGQRSKSFLESDHVLPLQEDLGLALIGSPLVGSEVVNNPEVAPLSLFKWCTEQSEIVTLLPVGSRGVLAELQVLFAGEACLSEEDIVAKRQVDLQKSAGPATCFLIIYEKNFKSPLLKEAKSHFNELKIIN